MSLLRVHFNDGKTVDCNAIENSTCLCDYILYSVQNNDKFIGVEIEEGFVILNSDSVSYIAIADGGNDE